MQRRPVLHMWVVVTLSLSAGCAKPQEPDAYGNVEATDVVVSAEAGGRLTSLDVAEGQTLAAAAAVGVIDSTELGLQRDQLAAQRDASASRVTEIGRQIDVLEAQRAAATAERDAARNQRAALGAQLEIARRNHERMQRLAAQQAATSQQLDHAEKEDRVLTDQVRAQDDQISAHDQLIEADTRQIAMTRAQLQTATHQVSSADAQVAQAAERLRKSQITNPVAGTVLATYARTGEVVQAGHPLYRIANLDVVEVRAYVSEAQLGQITIGQVVRVTADVGKDQRQSIAGTISWISSQAEFTPTPIQTRDDRADLVYAVKIRVPNEHGVLKIGMPADVQLGQGSEPK